MEEELFEFHNIFLNRLEGSTIQEKIQNKSFS